MKWLFGFLGLMCVIGGVLWFKAIEEISLLNWQVWVAWLIIWFGVNVYGEYLKMRAG